MDNQYKNQEHSSDHSEKSTKFKKWLKRVGIGGLVFFTVKGLIWLLIFYFGADALNACLAK